MKIFIEDTIVPYNGTVVVLGDFDGIHTAHCEIIKKGQEYASRYNLKLGVFIFKENTKCILEGDKIKLITDNLTKKELLEKMGVDFIYKVSFINFMKRTPDEFIDYLKKHLNIKAVFTGYDYKFGYMASGNVEILESEGKRKGFNTVIVPEMKINNHTVSSTYIRSLIKQGDMEETKQFLGRYFSIRGIVEKGFQNGRKIGFPTANVAYEKNIALPGNGVYAGYSFIDNKKYKSVINVGSNPTFNAKKITVESHIMDFNNNIYGKQINVYFVKKIRNDIKFCNVKELKQCIQNDIVKANNVLTEEVF